MQAPDHLRYTEQHEWVHVLSEKGVTAVRIGITDFAQDALGEVVYVELPEVDKAYELGEMLAEVESTKSVAEIYAPVSGTVRTVNERLLDEPELVNSSPYEEGWFAELIVSLDGLDDLLTSAQYVGFTEE